MLLWKETKRALRSLLLPMTLGLKNTLATETFSTDSDEVTVGEHVDLIVGTFRSRCELCVVFESNVAKVLFDATTDRPLSVVVKKFPRSEVDPHLPNPNEGWREADRNFRRWTLSAIHRHQNPS